MSAITTVSSKQRISLSMSFLLYFIFQQLRFQLTETVRFEFCMYKNTSKMFAQQAVGTYVPDCSLQFYLAD